MKREIYLSFTDIKDHIDLSFLDKNKNFVELFKKGDFRSNGKSIHKYNSARLYYTQELPDEYDMRIELIIMAVGGEQALKNLILQYSARESAVVLGIPTRTGDSIEEGYISREMMQKLCNLGLELHFYYT